MEDAGTFIVYSCRAQESEGYLSDIKETATRSKKGIVWTSQIELICMSTLGNRNCIFPIGLHLLFLRERK